MLLSLIFLNFKSFNFMWMSMNLWNTHITCDKNILTHLSQGLPA